MAIVEYTRKIRLNPNDAAAYYNRGKAYYQKYWDSLGSAIIEKGRVKQDSTGATVWAKAPIDEAYHWVFLDAAKNDFQAALHIEPNNALYKKEVEEFGM